MKDTELIEGYLFNKLNGNDLKLVKERISNDPPFETLVNEYKNTFAVLERNWLRNNVAKAAGQFFWIKVLKMAIAIIAVSTVVVIAGYKYFKQKNNNKNTVITEQTQSVSVHAAVDSNDNAVIQNTIDSVISSKVSSPLDKDMFSDKNDISHDSYPAPEIKKDSFSSFVFKSLFADDFQKFTIDPSIANEIKCKGGTIVNLPAHSLALSNGSEPGSEVSISVQEYSDYFEMWKHQVSTTSNQQLLQTGGSCFISAECDGEKVDIKKGQDFTIAFTSEQDDRMRSFTGERDTLGEMNWHPDNRIKKADDISSQTNGTLTNANTSSLKDTSYCFRLMISDEGFFDRNTDQYTFNVLSKMQNLYSVFDTFRYVKSEHIKKLYMQKSKLRLRFGVDSLGRLEAFDYNFRKDRKVEFSFDINRKLERQLRSVAEYIVANKSVQIPDKQGANMIINLDLVAAIDKISEGVIRQVDTAASKEEQINTQQSNMNIIASSSFGYINCDFFRYEKDLVNIKIGIPSEMTDVRVFFKNYATVVRCRNTLKQAQYPNIPKNEPVMIVATLIKNNELVMCLKETFTGEEIELDNFIPFDTGRVQTFLLRKNP